MIDKILFEHGLFGMARFLGHVSVDPIPHAQIMSAIELFGTMVAPAIRRETARATQPLSALSSV